MTLGWKQGLPELRHIPLLHVLNCQAGRGWGEEEVDKCIFVDWAHTAQPVALEQDRFAFSIGS